MSIPFFIVVIVTIIFSSSQGDCQVTPDLSTQFVTSSDSASQTDWTKKGSIVNVKSFMLGYRKACQALLP